MAKEDSHDYFYDRFCEPTFRALFEKIDKAENARSEDRKEILEQLNKLNYKLFVDSGHNDESFQTRINSIESWIKRLCWAVSVLVVPVFLIIVRSVWDFFMKQFYR